MLAYLLQATEFTSQVQNTPASSGKDTCSTDWVEIFLVINKSLRLKDALKNSSDALENSSNNSKQAIPVYSAEIIDGLGHGVCK